jgi:carbon monoxide dehydrogenase subunit G
MHFQHRVVLPADRERAWQFLMDMPSIGRCVPGVTEVTPEGQNDYLGTMNVRIGPIALNLAGKLTVLEQDATRGRALLGAQASDRRAGGSVTAKIELQLEPNDSESTSLLVTTDANVLGKLGEFGQPLIRKKADQTMQEFSRNVQKALA